MRVLVTGATGHLGSAVVPELVRAGHDVVGLVRSAAKAGAVRALGAEPLPGDLDDLAGLRAAASAADGVVHLAFKHDLMFSGDYLRAAADDLAAVRAFGDALAGSGKPLVVTSGTATAARPGHFLTEDDRQDSGPRIDAENAAVALAERGVRSSVVRLPPVVHSTADRGGFVPTLIGFAKANGAAGYLGDGANRWPAVHTADAARLYRLALEHAPAGALLHAVDDEGVPFRAIAEVLGARLGLPVAEVPAEEAGERFGFLAGLTALDIPATSAKTRALLDWRPTGPDLLADLAEGRYFDRPE